MINLIKLQCPNCGANLEVDSSLKQCFCLYCGAKMLLNNGNEYTIRIIDDAKIKEAELQHDLEVRKLQEQRYIKPQEVDAETEFKNKLQDPNVQETLKKRIHRKRVATIIIAAVIGIIGIPFTGPLLLLISILLAILWYTKAIPEQEELKAAKLLGFAQYPKNIGNLQETDKEMFMSSLKSAGFINIAMESCHDMVLGITKKNGKISRILIDSKTPVPGKIYRNDAEVVIMYHGR